MRVVGPQRMWLDRVKLMNSSRQELREHYPDSWRWISLARRISGWLTDREANALFEIARERTTSHEPIVVELGSWQGKSSILLAAGVCAKPNARVFCVDPFGSDEDPDIQAKHYSPLIEKMRHSLEEGFQRNVRRSGVGHIVRALKGYSYEVVRSWKDPIDLLFIDASHHYENVHRDFALWSPFVKVGGIIALHDVQAAWPGPSRVMAEDLQPPQYADLEQVDSLAWAVKQPYDPASQAVSSTARRRFVVTRVDFEARLQEIVRLSNEVESLSSALSAAETARCQALERVGVYAEEIRKATAEIGRQVETQNELKREIDQLRVKAAELRDKDAVIDSLRRSWSWRITAPIRLLIDAVRATPWSSSRRPG